MKDIDRIHQQIYDNKEWRAWAKMVDGYTTDDDAEFGIDLGIGHWFDMSRIAADFVADLGGTLHEITLADIAGMLCGCGLICGYRDYAKNGARIARAFLEGNFLGHGMLSPEDIDIICHAIAHHDTGNDIRNVVDAALCMAGKIDVAKNRIKDPCTPTQEQLVHVKSTGYSLSDDGILILNYNADGNFMAHEFMELWPESYIVPYKAATFLGKKFAFFLNDGYRIWESDQPTTKTPEENI